MPPPAGTNKDADAWAARLAPWASALRDCLRADAKADELGPARSFPWLELALPVPSGDARQDARELVLMRQALELLGLLAFRCHAAWKALLRSHCAVDASDDALLGVAQLAPRFLLLLDGDSGPDVERSCARLLASSDAGGDQGAEEFARVRSELLAAPADRSTAFAVADNGQLAPPRVAVCLEFAPSFVSRDAAAQYLASVRATVARLSRQEQPARWFALESVRLATNAIELGPAMGDALADLVRMGVRLSMLSFTLDESGTHSCLATRATLGSIVSSVLAVPQQQQQRRDDCALVERVSLLALRADVHQFAGLLSALADSGLADGVDLILDEQSAELRSYKWKWVAFAAFRAGLAVRRVEIYDQFLLRDDVEAMRRLLGSADPLSLLRSPLNERSGAASGRQGLRDAEHVYYIHVKPDAGISLEPLRNVIGWSGRTLKLQRAMRVRAIEYDEVGRHFEVMVPGYGHCWVHLEDVASVEKLPIADVERLTAAADGLEQHQVSSLTVGLLGSTVRDPLALRSLMSLVGGPLRRLSLYQKEPLAHHEVQAILGSCPRLEHLKLHNVELDSMDLFMDAYERAQGPALSTLILDSYRAPGESLGRFAELLATPSSRAARSLRELCLRSPTDVDAIDERCLRAFLKVLEANASLEYLELRVGQALFERFAWAFQSHHGDQLATVRRPVPRACKVALLAAAYAAERRIGQHNLVHERLLGHIFEYAATRATRTVLLRGDEQATH